MSMLLSVEHLASSEASGADWHRPNSQETVLVYKTKIKPVHKVMLLFSRRDQVKVIKYKAIKVLHISIEKQAVLSITFEVLKGAT